MVRRRPAGATHDHAGSGDYWLAFAPMIDVEIHGAEGRAAPPGPGGVAVQLGGGPRRAGLALVQPVPGIFQAGRRLRRRRATRTGLRQVLCRGPQCAHRAGPGTLAALRQVPDPLVPE
jgi:hypothetical protein